RGEIGDADLGAHLEQRTALEVDAEVQPMGEEQRDRDDRQQRRDRKGDAAELGEVEMGVVGNDAQRRQNSHRADDRQDDNEDAEANDNVMSHFWPRIRSARFAAASTKSTMPRSGVSS